ncbi:MAG: LysM peptidoglycan-binding domain-containing protein [Dermatophilaceae bacterium]|nr:LysM peptidoglycan-binding domain-containing protein [Intrasporangiaceae bacterium]
MSYQEVIFRQVLPTGPSVKALLGDAPISSKAGAGGGWEIIDRPKRKSFTDWAGHGPYVTELTVLFDGLRDDRSVEPELDLLRRMMRIPDKSLKHPPIIKVEGAIPLSFLRWVIQDMESQEEVRRGSDGARVRSFQKITLLEFVAADVLKKVTSPAATAQEAAPASTSSSANRTYTVKSGDTLWALATRFLGHGNKWEQIAKMNNIRDPKRLKIGTVLRLP